MFAAALMLALAAEVSGYDALMRDAKLALSRSDLDAARELCKQAVAESGEGADARARASRAQGLCGEVELKAKQHKQAAKAFREAAVLAGDDPRQRKKMLDLRARAATEGKMTKQLERVREVIELDQLLESTRKKRSFSDKEKAELSEKLGHACAVYHADKDPEREELAHATRSLLNVRCGALEDGEREAREQKKSRSARIVSLEALQVAGQAKKDLELTLRSALELNALLSDAKPDEQRRYVRMAGLDAQCARYDNEKGTGSCARLEKQVTGRWTFTDLSRGKPKRELSDDDLARVHAQLLPAIEDCVLSAAKKAPDAFANTDVEIAWAVQPQGRATDLEVSPKRMKQDVEACVVERLAWARYPRYTSNERKTVRVPYRLNEILTY